MSIPRSGQTVHSMTWLDAVPVRRAIEGRNVFELQPYTTDNLRRLYQDNNDDLIKLRDGIVTRAEIVAEIRWRVLVDQWGYRLLLIMTVIEPIAAVVAACEGWK